MPITAREHAERIARSAVKSVRTVSTRRGATRPDPAKLAAVAFRVQALEDLARALGITPYEPTAIASNRNPRAEGVRDGVLLAIAATSGADDQRAALGALTELLAAWTDPDLLDGVEPSDPSTWNRGGRGRG